jgi:type I restriction enzyme S subunit
MEEALWVIPENWSWSYLSSIGDVVAGGTPSSKVPAYWGGKINWISPADLTGYSRKTIRKGNKSISEDGLKNSSAKVMPAGSIHFSSRAPIGYVVISAEPMATNQGFKSLIPAQGIFNEFVYYYLKASKQLAEKRASGTTFLELSGKAFGLLPIPVPPHNEQKRIVAKIEELFSELDSGITALKTAHEQLKVYRQAVLKHAFEGKLTEEWRDENSDKLEAPEQLLAGIQQERENRYQQRLKVWKAAVREWEANGKEGRKPNKPKKLAQLTNVTGALKQDLPELPLGWSYIKLGNLIDEPTYGTSAKCDYETGEQSVLRIPNISAGKVDDTDLKFASFGKGEIDHLRLNSGDILTVRSNGSISLVGSCALISDKDVQHIFAGYLIRLRPNKNVIVPKFLLSAMESHFLRKQIESAAKSTSGVNNINSGEFQNLILPLPSIEEQKELMSSLDSLLSLINATELEIKSQLSKAGILRQSILKKAFSGQLVQQDSNDEPANELLARIQAEKAAAKPKVVKKPAAKRGRKSKVAPQCI